MSLDTVRENTTFLLLFAALIFGGVLGVISYFAGVRKRYPAELPSDPSTDTNPSDPSPSS